MEFIRHTKTLPILLAALLSSVAITGCSNQQVVAEEDAVQNETVTPAPQVDYDQLPCCDNQPYQPIVDVPQPVQPAIPAPKPNIPLTTGDVRPAVQVIAASDLNNARSMYEQMRSAGYNPVIVQIDGLYKVRVRYNSYEQAKANISRIATIAPDAFVVP